MIGVERFDMAQFTGVGGSPHEPVPPDPEVLKAQQYEHWKKGAIRRSYGKFTEMQNGVPIYAFSQLADRLYTAGFELGVRNLSQKQLNTLIGGVRDYGIVDIQTVQHGNGRPRYFLGEGQLQAVVRVVQEVNEMPDFSPDVTKPLAGAFVLEAMSKSIDRVRKAISDPEHPVLTSINQENVEAMKEAVARLKEGKHTGGPKGTKRLIYEQPREVTVRQVKFPQFDKFQKEVLESVDALRISKLLSGKIQLTTFDPSIRAAAEALLSCQEVTKGTTFESLNPQMPYNVARLRAGLKLAQAYLDRFGSSATGESSTITNLRQLVDSVKSVMEKEHPELVAKLRIS